MTAHRFHPSVLRAYDIRGAVGDTITQADAQAIGRGFATMLRRRGGNERRRLRIAVGYDGRISSPGFAAAVASGACAAGVDVGEVGLGPTPMLYYAVRANKLDGGVMVTGSHNPPDMNGFKLMYDKAAFFGDDITTLGALAAAGDFETGAGRLAPLKVDDAYLDGLVAAYTGGRELTVAWDAGNGAAGEIMRRLTQRLPGRHVLLYADIDGGFPNHHPDPTVAENLVDLQQAVAENGCDLGVAFDGDGDRIGVVDGRGRILWGDQLLALWAQDVLAANPGATVIADVKASQALYDRIAELGGKPLMWKTGHSMLKAKMAQTGAPLAGEMSGHVFFADKYYGFDDAPYAAVRLLNILAAGPKSLAELRDAMPNMINTPEMRIDCPDARKFAAMDEIAGRVAARAAAEKLDVNTIDGVRVTSADGWWLLRASNTQPVLVARCEARTNAALSRLKAAVDAELAASGVAGPKW